MARKKNHIEFRVGLITLLAFLILFGSLYWLQGYKLERNAQHVQVVFNDVGNLSAGDRVTVLGVDMGKVNTLKLAGNGVLVELLLYRDVTLRKDAQFQLKNLGVMGERFIAIKPGLSSEPFDTTKVAIGQAEVGLPELIGTVGDIVSEIRAMVAGIRQTVGSDTSLARFNRTVANIEHLSSKLDLLVANNDTKFEQAADNIAKASGELQGLLSRNAKAVDSSVARFQHVSVSLDSFVLQLDTLSRSVRVFADQLNTGDGSLQLLMQDRRLYDDLRGTASSIDELIADIKANPRKYINLKVEIF